MLRHARFVIPILLLIGCGGGSDTHKKDGGAAADGGLGGGSGGITGAGGLTGTAGSGIAGAAMPTGSLVFTGGGAQLLNQGPPCNTPESALGDRWCAFIAASVSNPGHGDLFAVNVSKVAAGTSVTCGLTDPNCLRLTDNFGQGQNDTLHAAFFSGDTLVYYELTGTPFAWRPGMTAGRALAVADPTTLDVILCTPARKGTGVFCLRDLPTAMQTDPTNILLSDLLVGRVDDTATPPLVKVETVISASSADVNVVHFEVDFPTPDTIAWSARSATSGPEVLKVQTIGNDASRATVASAINGWTASPDGARWYWLSAVSESTGAGTLQSAPFPGGASPVMIAPTVLQYGFPTPTSLMLVDGTTAKSMLAFADPVGAPTTSSAVDTGVLGWISLSSQGHAAYVKKTFTTAAGTLAGIDLNAKKSDGTGACVLTSATDAYPRDIHFTPSASGLAWIQQATGGAAAQFTRLSDCMKMAVSTNVVWVEPIGDRALLYLDGFDSVSGTAYMRAKNAPAGAVSSDPATQISAQVGSFVVTSSVSSDMVVYTVNGGSNDDGVYVKSFGP